MQHKIGSVGHPDPTKGLDHPSVARIPPLHENGLVDLRLLREATQAQHDSVERSLPLTDLGLDLDRYQRLLRAFYHVVHSWESWARMRVPLRLANLVNRLQRAPLLLRDLQFFGLSPAPDFETSTLFSIELLLAGREKDAPEYEAAFLGAMYVMEGSTLGGQYIARHVEHVLALTPGQGDAYFRGYGEQTGSMWNAFRDVLGTVSDAHTDLVIAAAKAMFACVEEMMGSYAAGIEAEAQIHS